MPLLKRILKGEKMGFRELSSAKQAIYLLQKGKPSPARKKAAGVRKQEKRANHREETARIRDAVFLRAGWDCELGMHPAGGIEMHHLEGGPTRRSHQAVANCIRACGVCHRLYHRSPESFRATVLGWCAKHEYAIPRRFKGEAKGNAPEAQEKGISS